MPDWEGTMGWGSGTTPTLVGNEYVAVTDNADGRVDILSDGSGRETAWENLAITSPSAVPKVSEANELIYLYTRDERNPADLHAWYFTAVDFHTGEVVFKQLTGTGWLFNNHYGSISISPEGTAYVGTMVGIVKIKDRGN